MPRLKKSLGRIKIQSPFIDELQRYLMYELANCRHWNPKTISGGMTGVRQWQYVQVVKDRSFSENDWEISFNGEIIIVESKSPKVEIRKGLYFSMGHATLVVEGSDK